MVSTPFGRCVDQGFAESLAAAVAQGDNRTDFRTALCGFEDDLFASYPAGHGLMEFTEAQAMVQEIFATLGRRAPRLALVPGFADPRVGGYADVARHRIAIERGHLYRFLVLHESAHLIVPQDRYHGPAFTFVLQLLYRSFIHIPDDVARQFLRRHRLPSFTGTERRLAA